MLLVHSLQGVNWEAINHITSAQWLSVDVIMHCLTDQNLRKLAPKVWSAYLKFATAAIVEPQLEESGVSSDHIWRAYVSS